MKDIMNSTGTCDSVTTLGELRKTLGEKVNHAAFANQHPLISHNGKTVSAIISYDDLKLLEEYENLLDAQVLRADRAEDDGARIPLNEALANTN